MKFKILSLFTALAIAFSCAFGMTACSKPVTVKSVEINADGDLIITMTDGSKSNIGKVQGNDGVDGAGVANAYIDDNGNLIIELTTGETINCGEVASPASKDFYYAEVKENGEVTGYTVTGLADKSKTGAVIPASFNKKPVVGIEAEAFSGCGEIISVKIPDSVKTIGARAFADCTKLLSVSFGSGIEEVGAFAFARCEALESVNITDIGAWCGVSFDSPSSNPLYFAHNLYLNNVLVTALTVPGTVSKIGDFAFYECNSLTDVTANGVTAVGERAFYNCPALTSFVCDSVETIGGLAFTDCVSLKTLSLGNKLKNIGEFAFNRCSSLTEVTIPSSTEEIGENAFAECSALKDLTLNFGLKTIGRGAFCGCSSLEKFIMPDSVTFIDFGILMNTYGGWEGGSSGGAGGNLEIRISNSLKEISDYAFSECSIRSIIIGNSVEKINYSSFFGCAGLESIVLPESLKHIASYSFYRCDMLQTVFYEGTPEQWERIFVGRNGNDSIRTSRVYYYSPAKPAAGEFFWHYVNGVPTPWEN